jgi:hypothetical protein
MSNGLPICPGTGDTCKLDKEECFYCLYVGLSSGEENPGTDDVVALGVEKSVHLGTSKGGLEIKGRPYSIVVKKEKVPAGVPILYNVVMGQDYEKLGKAKPKKQCTR